jgi:hypothetical protein
VLRCGLAFCSSEDGLVFDPNEDGNEHSDFLKYKRIPDQLSEY